MCIRDSIYALGAGSLIWETRIMNILYFNFLWLWGFMLFYISGWLFHRRPKHQNSQNTMGHNRLKKSMLRPAFYSSAALVLIILTLPLVKTPVTSLSACLLYTSISSVIFNPEGKNVAVTIPIESVVVNGQTWNYGGYIDIGLIDTCLLYTSRCV